MFDLKQKFFNPVCLGCGSYFVEDFLFCNFCFDVHVRPRTEFTLSAFEKIHSVAHLFEWHPDQSDLMSEMVYRFKSNRCRSAWEYYGVLAATKLNALQKIDGFDCVIPVPGSKSASVHAHIFAEIISKKYSIPILNILEKTSATDSEKEQKQKDISDRMINTFRLREQITHRFEPTEVSNLRVLVVDDIKTTGNSFKQVLSVLGLDKSATLLTLFSRTVRPNTELVS